MDKKLVRDCFDRASGSYDSIAAVQRFASRDLIDLINATGVSKISSIIDIGCGTGNTSLALYEKYPGAEYTLCDISEEMLRVAEQKFPCAVKKINCDAENYEFSQYDLAISNLCMQWFLSPCAFIKKAKNFFKTFAFTTLIDTSFQQYRSYFEVPPIFEYPSVYQLSKEIGKNYQIKKYSVEFQNFFDLCRYFKALGAQAKSGPSPVLKSHCNENIILDYEIFMCVLR